MNSIKQAIFDLKKPLKVQVKIGSNQICLSIAKNMSCLDFIRAALNQCKIYSSNTYELFEKANGIERLLKASENIYLIVSELDAKQCNEFIIKKCRKSQIISKSMSRNRKYGQKLFNKLREKSTKVQVPKSDLHLYEDINENFVDEEEPTRPKPLRMKSDKISKFDSSIVKKLKNVRKIIDELKLKNIDCQLTFKKEFFL